MTTHERVHEDYEKPETERKFLTDNIPERFFDDADKFSINQGYLMIRDNKEIRVRSSEIENGLTSYTLTIKDGSSDVTRSELEVEITEQEFSNIWPLTVGKRIKKDRYKQPIDDDHTLELDIYKSSNIGLVVVEVEFKDEEDANSFIVPNWLGREVTYSKEFKNKNLARHNGSLNEVTIPEEVDKIEALQGLITYAEVLSRISSKPIIMAVAGGSASGKTTIIADKVAEHFGSDARIISLDDYYKGESFMQDSLINGIELNWDQPEAVDLEKIGSHLSELVSGSCIEKPIYSFKTGEPEGTEKVDPLEYRVIIVEGLFALYPEIVEFADITTFVNTSSHGRMIRRLLRDIERSSWELDEILTYFGKVEEMHQEYVQPTSTKADVLISNQYSPEEEAVRSGEYEFQIKYAIDPNVVTEKLLRQKGAELIASSILQKDSYFIFDSKSNKGTTEIVRIRNSNGEFTFSYKGNQSKDKEYRQRPKIEFSVSNEILLLVESIYSNPVKQISKTRSLYLLNGVIVAVDRDVSITENSESKFLGDFIELRSSNSGDMLADVAKKLGISQKPETRAYFDINK